MFSVGIYGNFVCVCARFPGPDNGKSEGYGLRLVRPDVLGQEIEGKHSRWSAADFFSVWIHTVHLDSRIAPQQMNTD